MCQREREILARPGDKPGLEVFIQTWQQMVLSVNKETFGKVLAGRDRAETGAQTQLSKVTRTECCEISTRKPGVKEN